jgi:hypothetical protein
VTEYAEGQKTGTFSPSRCPRRCPSQGGRLKECSQVIDLIGPRGRARTADPAQFSLQDQVSSLDFDLVAISSWVLQAELQS